LSQSLPFPVGRRPLRYNPKTHVLGIVVGSGSINSAASIMALGLDTRFDLSKAYWLVAGIAGADPAKATLGSAVWTDWVIDGDLGYEIDAREIPADWSTGFVPLGKLKPYELPAKGDQGQVYELNLALMEWAYSLTKDTPLGDTDAIRARRAQFDQQVARKPPTVLKGSELSSSTYWHGKKLDEWANAWVSYYTEGKGTFVTTAMEDTGTLQSLTFLAKAGKVDYTRVMVLRTVSNFDQQRPGITAAESLAEQRVSKYGGYLPSLESAYTVGHIVVDQIAHNWPKYQDHLPSGN